jgi:lipid-binding SYLF domain-containing protein
MHRLISISAAMALVLAFSGAQAASKTETRVENAVEVFSEFTEIPEQGIPTKILNDAYGIAIIPGLIKVGFTFGGRYGRGVLMVRHDDGTWSNPAFVSMGGGSFGFQIGAQSTDIVLVFRDKRSVDNISKGKMTLGGDASVAAGPVGRQTSAATDGTMAAEIYSYSRNRGLFAGISVEGAWIGMDKKSNQAYYDNGMSPEQILAARDMAAPAEANKLVALVATTVPALEQSNTPTLAAVSSTEVTTYALEPVATETTQVTTYELEPVTSDLEMKIIGPGDETQF